MSFVMQHALKAYARVDVETGVPAADPHRLVLMLFDGAITAVIDAQRHLVAGALAARGESVSKAIMIIEDGLRASLDVKAGGAMAENLASLYEYMTRRLLSASVKGDGHALEEVRILLGELRGAWAAIPPARMQPAAQPAAQSAARAA